jgi:hypothetical protein
MRYAADPPRIEEIVAVMRQAGEGVSGDRIRGLIVVYPRGRRSACILRRSNITKHGSDHLGVMREGQAVGAVWRRPRSRGVSGEGVLATAPPDSSLPPRIDADDRDAERRCSAPRWY